MVVSHTSDGAKPSAADATSVLKRLVGARGFEPPTS
jgi:hypothetical protein